MKKKRMTSSELLNLTNCCVWEIDGEFYPVKNFGEGQVVDIGGRDAPPKYSGAFWNIANATISGVKYVASPSPTRAAALARIRRAFLSDF